MKLVFAAFALISFVNGKSLIIHDNPLLGVKYVDNQQPIPNNAELISSGGISVQHDNLNIPALEIEVKSAGGQNLKETNERQYIDAINRKVDNLSELKLKTDNGIYAKTISKSNAYLLPNLLSGGVNERRFNGDDDDSNDIRGNELLYSSNGRTFPLTRSFSGRQYIDAINRKFDNPSELKLKTDNGIYSKIISKSNAYLLPNLLSGGINERRFNGDENDSNDIRGNELLYSSNGKIFPLTRSFSGRQYIDAINRKFDNPSEQNLKTDNGIYSKTTSKSNAYLVPNLLGIGISNQRFHGDEDDSNDIRGSDSLYSSKGRTFPLTRSFSGRQYVDANNRKFDNPSELKTDNGIYSKTSYKSNAYLLPSSLGGGINERKFNGDENESNDIRGSDSLYSSKGRTFPLTRSFSGRQYVDANNRKFDNPSELKTDNGIYSKTSYKSNAYLLPSSLGGGINERKFNGDENESNDIRGSDSLYSNNGRTFPLTRSFEEKNYVNLMNNRKDDALNPTEQKLNKAYVFILKNDSQVSPNMLYSLLNGAMNVDNYSTKVM